MECLQVKNKENRSAVRVDNVLRNNMSARAQMTQLGVNDLDRSELWLGEGAWWSRKALHAYEISALGSMGALNRFTWTSVFIAAVYEGSREVVYEGRAKDHCSG